MSDSINHDPFASVALRPVTSDDREFLVSVYADTRARELAQTDWTPDQKHAFIRWQFGLQHEEYMKRYPDARYSVVLVDGVPAGRIWIGEDDKQIRLLDIAILQPFQNRGVGTHLLRQLMADATKANKVLRHMVFVLNDNAHRFYERLGFVVIEDLDSYKHMEWAPGQSQTATS